MLTMRALPSRYHERSSYASKPVYFRIRTVPTEHIHEDRKPSIKKGMGRPLRRGAQEKTFHEERHINQLSEDRNWKWEDREDAAPRKNESNLFEYRRRASPKEHIHRKSEGIHTRGEGSFSRYDATAMLTMRPRTALPVDATSVVPLKKNDTTSRWVCVSTIKCFSTKRFDSGSTIHHAQANSRRRVATKKCRLLR
jgi:hypothetical protein